MTVRIFSKEKQENQPVIIGMPGFVRTLRGGRIETILKEMSEEGYKGYGVIFDDIKRHDKIVHCHFNLDNYLKNVDEAFQQAKEDPETDSSRIGVIASSISGSVFAYYLAQNNPDVNCYLSISPLVGWDYYRTEQERNYALTLPFFPITTDNDKKKGIRRIVPSSSYDEMQKIDSFQALKYAEFTGMNVMTLVGSADDVADPNSIKDYHKALGGTKKGLIEYQGIEHAIPLELSKETIKDFFRRNLQE